MKKQTFPLFLLLCLFSACSDKYQQHTSKYSFNSTNAVPDYSNLDYWAAHPWKWDPSDSVPKPLQKEQRDSTVDVFFLHPTTFTDKEKASQKNASIDDAYINAKTDYSSILYQASVFNKDCRVFAPRYRQAHIQNFYSADTVQSKAAFELAYQDIKTAFAYYLQHYNQGRPIIIAGHSQGSLLAERLLKEFFDGTTLHHQLVAAYIVGWVVPENLFSNLPICKDSLQTGCICSWRTYRNGYTPSFKKNETFAVYVTNPISWTTEDVFVSRKMNKGSVLTKFNKLYKKTTDARIDNGFVYTRKPRFPWSFLFFSKNYHVGDINLYYMNIRENVKQRIDNYWKK